MSSAIERTNKASLLSHNRKYQDPDKVCLASKAPPWVRHELGSPKKRSNHYKIHIKQSLKKNWGNNSRNQCEMQKQTNLRVGVGAQILGGECTHHCVIPDPLKFDPLFQS